ncbi:hypothetical protein F5I97DRAFT_1804348, partial [Phlebopus sp. FC_14]
YHKWCKVNDFESKLSADVKACQTAIAVSNAKQGTLDDHVREIEPGEWVISYTDKEFYEATVEWLISTNQATVDHPSFCKMIDVASRAIKGVLIPNCKVKQAEIIDLFKKQMTRLWEHLNISLYFLLGMFSYLPISRARW